MISNLLINAITLQWYNGPYTLEKQIEEINSQRDLNDLLLLATRFNRENWVKVLLEHGSNPNACDQNGDTPLIWAARLGVNLVIVKSLLKCGADLHIQNKQGKTAIDFAQHPNLKDLLGNKLAGVTQIPKEAKLEKIQEECDLKLNECANNLSFILDHLTELKHINGLGKVLFNLANVAAVLNAETLHNECILVANDMHHPDAQRLVKNFNFKSKKEDKKEEEILQLSNNVSPPTALQKLSLLSSSNASLDSNITQKQMSPSQKVIPRQ